MSAGNFGQLCRDIIAGSLTIKGRRVLNSEADLRANEGTFRGDVRIRGNLTVDGCTTSSGSGGCCVLPATNLQDLDINRQQQLRSTLASKASNANDQSGWPNNGDEDTVPMFLSSFTKCINHDAQGRADPVEANKLLTALQDRDTDLLGGIVLDLGRKFAHPRAALSLNLVGPSPAAISIPPAPKYTSAETAGEMVEDYCKLLCRDIPFADFGTDVTVGNCVGYMNALSDFKGPKPVTPSNIFRGTGVGDLNGPFISQFLVRDVGLWPKVLSAQTLFPTRTDANDRMTTFPAFLSVQNGASPANDITLAGSPTYTATGRDLAYSVWQDAPGQMFLLAGHLATQLGVPLSPKNPYLTEAELGNQGSFVTWSFNDFITSLETATLASLRTAWYGKWFAHRRTRPEAFGGEVEQVRLTTMNPAGIHPDLLTSGVLPDVLAKQGTHLLSQTFPEGSPSHPAYPAGHACFSGVGTTMLKAFFNESWVFPDSQEPNAAGTSTSDSGDTLTFGGEANKLASNITLGRDWAGVHYRSDGTEGILAGEKVAIEVLKELVDTHNEPNCGFQFTGYLGNTITIQPSSASQFAQNFTL